MSEVDPDDPFQGLELERSWWEDHPYWTAVTVASWAAVIVWVVFYFVGGL